MLFFFFFFRVGALFCFLVADGLVTKLSYKAFASAIAVIVAIETCATTGTTTGTTGATGATAAIGVGFGPQTSLEVVESLGKGRKKSTI